MSACDVDRLAVAPRQHVARGREAETFAVLGSLCGPDPGRPLPLERIRSPLLLRGLDSEGSPEAQHGGGLKWVGHLEKERLFLNLNLIKL